jgi:hypothetical protein
MIRIPARKTVIKINLFITPSVFYDVIYIGIGGTGFIAAALLHGTVQYPVGISESKFIIGSPIAIIIPFISPKPVMVVRFKGICLVGPYLVPDFPTGMS